MKIVLSIDISPKLLGVLKEDEFQAKLKSRCLTLIRSYEKKWRKENVDLCGLEAQGDDVEINWAEMIQEGFEEVKDSVEARAWGTI